MRKIKLKITREMQEDLNRIRRECGFEEEPVKEDYFLDALYG